MIYFVYGYICPLLFYMSTQVLVYLITYVVFPIPDDFLNSFKCVLSMGWCKALLRTFPIMKTNTERWYDLLNTGVA